MGRLGRTVPVAVRIIRPRQAQASSNTVNVGQALETDTATATTRYKVAVGGRPTEIDVANSVARVKVAASGRPTETDTANSVARVKVAAIGRPTETDTANSISPVVSSRAQPAFFDFTSPAVEAARARFAVRRQALIVRAPRASGSTITTAALSEYTATTDLPSSTTFMAPILWANNGTTASAIDPHLVGLYIESDN